MELTLASGTPQHGGLGCKTWKCRGPEEGKSTGNIPKTTEVFRTGKCKFPEKPLLDTIQPTQLSYTFDQTLCLWYKLRSKIN
uniref:Uncharacterized protein n=1 Tax=Rhizophora mucronata TaxID=61149 RepID=A0A2P2MIS1_RHIMU